MDDSPAFRRHRSLAPARSGEPIHALASDPTTSSAAALLPWLAFRVMHQVLSWHGVPLPASSRRGLAGRKRSFPLAASPGSAHGIFFTPFAGLLPPKADAHLCESGPTCPFHRDPSARFIFVGLARLAFVWLRRTVDWPRPGLLGLTSRRSVRRAGRSHARTTTARAPILPWALPLAGLWTHTRAPSRARPRVDRQPPGVHSQRFRLAAASPASVRLGECCHDRSLLAASSAVSTALALPIRSWA